MKTRSNSRDSGLRRTFFNLTFALFSIASPVIAQAGVCPFTGTSGGNWNVGANWGRACTGQGADVQYGINSNITGAIALGPCGLEPHLKFFETIN